MAYFQLGSPSCIYSKILVFICLFIFLVDSSCSSIPSSSRSAPSLIVSSSSSSFVGQLPFIITSEGDQLDDSVNADIESNVDLTTSSTRILLGKEKAPSSTLYDAHLGSKNLDQKPSQPEGQVFSSSFPVVQSRMERKTAHLPLYPKAKSIMEVLDSDHRFTKLLSYLSKSTRLQDRFSDLKENLTVFAPTNAAFASISRMYPGKHFHENDIERILSYHVVSKVLRKQDLFHGRLLQSSLREDALEHRLQQIRVQRMDGYVLLNMYCKIEEYDLPAANGLIQVVNSVLIPPPNMLEELSVIPTEFSISNTALLLTGLDKSLLSEKGFTFFAPNNLAWQALGRARLMHLFDPARRENLREILLYHMSPRLLYSFEMTNNHSLVLPSALRGFVLHMSSSYTDEQNKLISDFDGFTFGSITQNAFTSPTSRGSNAQSNGKGRIFLKVNHHRIVFQDAIAQNGNMHIIEKVLCPCANRRRPGGDGSDENSFAPVVTLKESCVY